MNTFFQQLVGFARNRPIVATAFAIAVVLGAANYFFWQLRRSAMHEHDDARRKGEAMLSALTNRSQIDADLTALRAAMAYIEKNVLDEQSMEVNLGYFYKLEKPAHVRILRLNQLAPLPLPEKKPLKAVPFSMQISGAYRNVMTFVRALETGSRIVRIRSSSFERASNDASEYLVDLTVEALAKS